MSRNIADEAEDLLEGIITICLHPDGRILLAPKAQAALKVKYVVDTTNTSDSDGR